MTDAPLLITATLIQLNLIIGLAVLAFINYHRDGLPGRPTKPDMNDEKWDGK